MDESSTDFIFEQTIRRKPPTPGWSPKSIKREELQREDLPIDYTAVDIATLAERLLAVRRDGSPDFIKRFGDAVDDAVQDAILILELSTRALLTKKEKKEEARNIRETLANLEPLSFREAAKRVTGLKKTADAIAQFTEFVKALYPDHDPKKGAPLSHDGSDWSFEVLMNGRHFAEWKAWRAAMKERERKKTAKATPKRARKGKAAKRA